jgi:hypothetical protein
MDDRLVPKRWDGMGNPVGLARANRGAIEPQSDERISRRSKHVVVLTMPTSELMRVIRALQI